MGTKFVTFQEAVLTPTHGKVVKRLYIITNICSSIANLDSSSLQPIVCLSKLTPI